MSTNHQYLLWPEFRQQCLEFIDIANKLNDSWSWITKGPDEVMDEMGTSYLQYKQKLYDIDHELIQLEYHLVYSISYQVPVLYVQGYRSNGKLLGLEEMWQFCKLDETFKREEMLNILTQMDHPVLHKPFLCIHPCRTSELLAQTPQSDNFILTYLSAMGPYVQLKLQSNYGNYKKNV